MQFSKWIIAWFIPTHQKRKKKKKVMQQPQIILQHFYKMLMWPNSYWFLSRPTVNITFSFTNNHFPPQQSVKFFVK